MCTALVQGMADCINDRLDEIRRDRTFPEYRLLPTQTDAATNE